MVAEIVDIDRSRKLVTVRRIDAIDPIPGADAIEVATIGGWKVVIKKGEFKPGDPCVYFEIDSFLPDGNPAWQFLVDKQGRTFDGKLGHRLRTVKLRGQLSQGFVIPVSATSITDPQEGVDYAEALGVVKWDPPLPAELAGKAEGLFPSFIRKTDQERCQNLVAEIFGYEDQLVPFDISKLPTDAVVAMMQRGELYVEDGAEPHGRGAYKILRAKADPNAEYEVTIKLDGSSCTFFFKRGETCRAAGLPGKLGVCSRNLELKVNDENAGNSFVRLLLDSGLDRALTELDVNIAVQGELMGPGIQGNREELKDFKFFMFDVQLLDEGRYMTPDERYALMAKLLDFGVNPAKVDHVPVLHRRVKLQELGITNVQELLAFAEGPSIKHPVREGLVFKRGDGGFSFKAISNKYLASEKD